MLKRKNKFLISLGVIAIAINLTPLSDAKALPPGLIKKLTEKNVKLANPGIFKLKQPIQWHLPPPPPTTQLAIQIFPAYGYEDAPLMDVSARTRIPDVSLGEVRLTNTSVLIFKLKNTGEAPLNLRSVSLDPPSEQYRLEQDLGVDRNGFQRDQNISDITWPLGLENGNQNESLIFTLTYSPQSIGEHNTQIVFVSNDDDVHELRIPITALATAALPAHLVVSGNWESWHGNTYPVENILIDRIPSGQNGNATIFLRNEGEETLHIQSITLDNANFQIHLGRRDQLCTNLLGPANSCLIMSNNVHRQHNFPADPINGFDLPKFSGGSVQFSYGLHENNANYTITYSPRAEEIANAQLNIVSNDPERPNISIPITGVSIWSEMHVSLDERFSSAAGSIEFGTQIINSEDPKEEQITIRNDGPGPLTISSIALTGNEAVRSQFQLISDNRPVAGPIVVAAHSTFIFDLVYNPHESRVVHRTTLDIASDDPTNPFISIPVRGVGILGAN